MPNNNQNQVYTEPTDSLTVLTPPEGFYSKNYYWTDKGGIFLDINHRRLLRNLKRAHDKLEKSNIAGEKFISDNHLGTQQFGDVELPSFGATLTNRRKAGLERWWDFGVNEYNGLVDQLHQHFENIQNNQKKFNELQNEHASRLLNATHYRPLVQDRGNNKLFILGQNARSFKYRDINPDQSYSHLLLDKVYGAELHPAETNHLATTDEKGLKRIANEIVNEGFTTKPSIYIGEDSAYNDIDNWTGDPKAKKKLKKFVYDEYVASDHALEDIVNGKFPFAERIIHGRNQFFKDTFKSMADTAYNMTIGEDGLTWDDALWLLPAYGGYLKAAKGVGTMANMANTVKRAERMTRLAKNAKSGLLSRAWNSKILTPVRYLNYGMGSLDKMTGRALGLMGQSGMNLLKLSKYSKGLPHFMSKYGGLNLFGQIEFGNYLYDYYKNLNDYKKQYKNQTGEDLDIPWYTYAIPASFVLPATHTGRKLLGTTFRGLRTMGNTVLNNPVGKTVLTTGLGGTGLVWMNNASALNSQQTPETPETIVK